MNHEPSLKTDHLRPPHPKTSNSVVNLNLNSNLGTKGHESKAPRVRVALDDDGKICGESESCPRRGDGVEENRGADPQTNPATAKSRGGGSGAIRLRDMHTRKRVARSVDAAREPGDDAMACDAARNAPA